MSDTRPCPFCAEPINVSAAKCRFCGEFLTDRAPSHLSKRATGRTDGGEAEVIYRGPLQAAAALIGPAIRLLICLAIAAVVVSVGRSAPIAAPIRKHVDDAIEEAKMTETELSAAREAIRQWTTYAGLAFGGIAFLLFVRRWLIWKTSRLRITGDRIEYELGILSKAIENVELHRIQDITFRRGILDLFLGLGRIAILSTDKGRPLMAIGPIYGARKLYDRLKAAQTAAKDRRGVVHVEG